MPHVRIDGTQLPLFGNDCATGCEAYAACGGNRSTAPCGCAWRVSSAMRYQCATCYLVCRERRALPSGLEQIGELAFASKIEEGYTLDQVRIRQDSTAFPLFIPTYTHKYRGAPLPLRWVAADVRNLFNPRRTREAVLNPHFVDEQHSRAYLQVNASCQLLAVLNGPDWMLESFWGMPRAAALQRLRASGFGIGTAATYSVTNLTTEGTLVPYAHHTAMLMRHHRVLDEMQGAGMSAIPNLYWLDGDRREIARWSDWLRGNPAIATVSRDFTATTHWSVIEAKVNELLLLLQQAGRSFHVLVVGTGRANAPRVLQKLVRAGHTATIITSAPIMKALSGVKYELDADGKVSEASCHRLEFPFSRLIEHNLAVFEQLLFQAIAGTQAGEQAVRNMVVNELLVT